MSDKSEEDGNDKRKYRKGSSTNSSPTDSHAGLDSDQSSPSKPQTTENERASKINQSIPKTHSSGRSILNNHHSMDIKALRQAELSNQNNLDTSGSKGKSASMDGMALSLQSKNTGSQKLSGNNNNPLYTTKDNFMKGRLFRSNKVAPLSGHLEEVFPISPVIMVPSTCNGTRNPSCVSSQIVGDSGHRPEASASNDSMENICRICHDSATEEKLITPCLCKGSMAKVHRTCLERWLSESGKSQCEICGQEYNTVRIPKYTGIRSFIAWIRKPLTPTDSRNFFFDLACFFILTPLAGLSAWLCVLGAKNYTIDEHKSGRIAFLNETQEARANRDASNSTWTSIGLLSLTGTLVAAYYVWMFVAVRYHLQVWKEWQQRNFIVTIVPLINGNFSQSPPPPRVRGEAQHDDSNSSLGFEVRRHEPRRQGGSATDRNNNSNTDCTQSDGPVSNQARVSNAVMQRSSIHGEISDTALFYQSVFGVDSDESISEQAMIRLATLRSEYDAITELQKNQPKNLNTISDPKIFADNDLENTGMSSLAMEKSQGRYIGILGAAAFDEESNTEDTVISIDSDDSIPRAGDSYTHVCDNVHSSDEGVLNGNQIPMQTKSTDSWVTVSASSCTGGDKRSAKAPHTTEG